MAKIQAIRGMNDILPEQTPVWQFVEGKVRKVLAQYGYQEIRMPIVEQTDLFKRSIGEVTDIVEKEMYTFDDRNGDSLTLRPEARPVVYEQQKNTGFCLTRRVGSGTPAPCSGTNVRRKGATVNFTRSVWSVSAWPDPISTPSC